MVVLLVQILFDIARSLTRNQRIIHTYNLIFQRSYISYISCISCIDKHTKAVL